MGMVICLRQYTQLKGIYCTFHEGRKYSKPTFSIIIGVDGDNVSVIVFLISCVVIQLV